MVNSPPDPNESRPGRFNVGFDEFVALGVAFLSIGAILLWGLTRGLGQRQLSWAALSDLASDSVSDANAVIGLDRPIFEDTFDGEDTTAIAGEATGDDSTLGEEGSRISSPWAMRSTEDTETALSGRRISPVPRSQPQTTSQTNATLAPVEAEVSESPSEGTSSPEAALPENAQPEDTSTSSPPPLSIEDVPQDHWAYPFISSMYEQELLPDLPSGQFEPEKQLTRADLAALLNQAFLEGEASQSADFTDISSDYWASEAIAHAVEANFMSGYPEGDFRPEQLVPRYQVLVALASGLGLRPVSNPQETLQLFRDADGVPNWAQTQVASATENGLVVNHPNRDQLQPQIPATRAEIIAMIYQALEKTGQVEPVQSEYVISGSQ